MDAKLPKGTFRGLAKILGPLLLWMAAGWAAFPYLMGRITIAVGETMDTAEVRLFSYLMTAACAIIGAAFIIYGYSGKEVPDKQITALNPDRWPCPVCLRPLPPDTERCEHCGSYVER